MVITKDYIKKYHQPTFAHEKHRCRQMIVRAIKNSPNPQEAIGNFLAICLTFGGSFRLDDPIDVLSQFGSEIEKFARTYPHHDRQSDGWYIVIKAVGNMRRLNRKVCYAR